MASSSPAPTQVMESDAVPLTSHAAPQPWTPLGRLVDTWARLSVERACILFFANLVLALLFAGLGAVATTNMEVDGGTSAFGIQGSDIAKRQQAKDNRAQAGDSRGN